VDPLALIARVDSALYRAKRAGRNRVAVADETPATT
jgi:PleD family two-component response regulator